MIVIVEKNWPVGRTYLVQTLHKQQDMKNEFGCENQTVCCVLLPHTVHQTLGGDE